MSLLNTPARMINVPARGVELLILSVDGTGTASLGGPCSNYATLVDNGVGDYTITFNTSFAEVPTVIATCLTADCIVDALAKTADDVDITLVDATDGTTAKDGDIELLVFGRSVADKF